MIISYSSNNHQFNMAKFAIACVLFSLVAVALANGPYGMRQTSYEGTSNGGYGGRGYSDGGYMNKGSSYGPSAYSGVPSYSNGGYMKGGPSSGGYGSGSPSYGNGNGYSSRTYGSGSSSGNAYMRGY